MTTLFGLVLCLATCRQETPSRSNDTVNIGQPPPAETTGTFIAAPAWDSRAGSTFAVPALGGSAAYLIFPVYTSEFSLDTVTFDMKTPVGTTLQLLRDGRQVALAQVAALTLDHADDCTTWPSAQLASPSGAPLPTAWTVGIDPKIEVLPIDSLAGLSSKDSVRLTVALARLASALPGDTASAFRGRPFVVRQASQFSDGTNSLVIAEIVRTVSQEAMPLQEHLLVIAQADTSNRGGFRQQYFERTIGVEDATETTEVLAIIRAGSKGLLVLVSRDLGDGVVYGMIERLPNGGWRMRWSSPYAGC
ncbi:MAG: hypothetical protein ABI877_02665 [Gemmatimonadaceae bacterium]